MSSKWECNFCGEILPKGPCVYINPVAKCHPGLCPMDHDKHAPWVAAQKEKEEAKPSASDNSDYTKCLSLLKRAWMELEHRSLEPDLTDEIEQHFA